MKREAFVGSLLGTATGDALGLPYEGLSGRRGARLFPDSACHHLLPGRGMVSDDTDHACFVAQALIRSGGDIDLFRRSLARSLRWWLASLPAGVGLATVRAALKLWVGVSAKRSGVFSAGNGPAMRASILGVALGDDPERMKAFVRASTVMTHTDPKAYVAALAVALAAYLSGVGGVNPGDYQRRLRSVLTGDEDGEFFDLVAEAARSAASGEAVEVFAARIGSANGISGYSYHTVPCVLQVWFRYPDDFAAGVQEIIRAGGDTDTAGAIFGGIVGAAVGKEGIPEIWRANVVEFPRTMRWIESLGTAVSICCDQSAADVACPRYFWPAVVPRNTLFLAIVLAHGLRRLAPPY